MEPDRSQPPVVPWAFAILLGLATIGCRPATPRHVPLPDDFPLHQREPDLDEDEVCGPIDGMIRRGDDAFGRLVEDSRAQVVFKDEEGTGADHLMSGRLSQCVDRLAGRVAEEWPGVQLRVTEAWDEDGEHREGSLHYEGRAADLTTSDRDTAKYGRLARLAVEAGFDFVWYEDELHVHASVRRAD